MMDKMINSNNSSNVNSLLAGRGLAPKGEAQAGAESRARGAKTQDDRKAFEAELSQAGAAAQQIQALPAQPMVSPRLDGESAVKAEGMKALENASGQQSLKETLAGQARDLMPTTMRTAASMSTAAAIAGLKPWSKEWVFQESPEAVNFGVEPLFGGKEGLEPEAKAGSQVSRTPTRGDLQAGTPVDSLIEAVGQELPKAEAKSVESQGVAARPNQQTQPTQGDVNVANNPRFNPALNPTGAQAQAAMQGQAQVLSPELASMLRQAEVSAQGPEGGSAVQGAPAKAGAQKPAYSGLSGGEFLVAMNAARDGNAQARASSGFGQDMSREQGQRERGAEGLQAMKMERPELRVIEGQGKGRRTSFAEELSTAGQSQAYGAQVSNGFTGSQAPATELSGHVTRGAMDQQRLSTESLMGMSSSIRNLSGQGGGEMRVRLKPDNLGELNLRVMTNGNQVGLQIQASDDKARKILEESLTHLKDSLAAQNLTLGRVDVSVAQPAEQRQDAGSQSGNQQQHAGQGAYQDMMGSNANQNHQSRGGQWGGLDEGFAPSRPLRASGAQALSGVTSAGVTGNRGTGSNRLDVRA